MKLDDSKTMIQACNISRRNFLKTAGAATVSGVSTLILPDDLRAETGRKSAAEIMAGAPTTFSEELYWRYVQSQFVLKPGRIYMNTGTEGSMPRFVLNNLRKDFKDFAASPTEALIYNDRCNLFMSNVRPKVEKFLGVDTDEVVMTTNTTEGLGWVANGLDLEEGDEVITTLHFPPFNSCWYFLRDRKKITLTELDLPTPATSKEEIVALFEEAITPQTKVMCFCHINYTTGLRMPVKEICEVAREHDVITVVDGAHAIGMINLDLHDLGCDFYATSPHKWLCAPPGTGVLYMRKEMQAKVWPVVTEEYTSPDSPIISAYFMFRGQQTTPAFAGVMDAIDFQNEIGKDEIEKRVLVLHKYAKEKIVENWGEQALYSPMDEELSTGLVSFNPFDDHYGEMGHGISDNISTLYSGLQDQDIITRTIGFYNKLADTQGTRVLRISTHIYNDFRQIRTAIDTAKDIVESIQSSG